MSKMFVALVVLAVAVAVQGCSDSCVGKADGPHRCLCSGPCHRYYDCHKHVIVRYSYCGDNTQCLIQGVCGSCRDSCHNKPNGDYPSLDNPRPFYYHCENGFLSFRTCHPNEVFNAWTRKCECYEVFCEKGDGFQPSMCGNGCNGYVMCEGGFAKIRRDCPRRRPYYCCHTHNCVVSNNNCGGSPCQCGH